MRKILTRLATLALILIVMVSFSACSLFVTDLDKKYSASIMVATTANDNLTISRQELYYGYLEWGHQYANQMETEDLLEYITSALLNNKILEKESIERFGAIRESEKALARKQAFGSLDTTIRTFVYEALGQKEEDESTDDSTDEEVDQPYEPSILVNWEKGERVFTLNLSDYADEDGLGMLQLSEFKTYTPTVPGAATTKNMRQAISKVVRNLQSLENGFTKLKAPENDYLPQDNPYFKHLTQAERDVLNREIDRMIRTNETSILVARVQTAFNLGFSDLGGEGARVDAWDDYLKRSQDFDAWADRINGIGDAENEPAYFGSGRVVATNIANKIIKNYTTQVTQKINRYKNELDQVDGLESSLVNDGLADVYFVPTEVANNLYTVSHILVEFTDADKTVASSNGVSAEDILDEVKAALNNTSSLQEKYDTFRTFINKYNSDPGMQNLDQLNSETNKPQYEYVMSVDPENTKMVEPFTKASVELFNKGVKGAISELVWTDYGAHIIMYTRDLADFIYTGNIDTVDEVGLAQADALFATLTAYGNRTLFDTLVDADPKRDYNKYQSDRLNDYRKDHEVTIINSEFKGFL
ncbi:MAG: hypothetical protein IJ295_01015 [Clostridia bacterium]|nr:hypothetical protein [Clostridia bacterium]